MKKTKLLLFLIGFSFFGCTGTDKSPVGTISDIATDFPITEKLEFKPFNKYDILDVGQYMIDGSILWQFPKYDERYIGYCYDLNTGKKLSTIASIGKASNEFLGVYFPYSVMTKDSIHLYAASTGNMIGFTTNRGEWTMKTFAKKDIVDNIPLGERKFSIITSPDTLIASKMVKLPNGSGLITTMNEKIGNTPTKTSIHDNSVVIFDNDEVKGYQTIDYNSFDLNTSLSKNKLNQQINFSYALGHIEVKDNKMAAFSLGSNFILYTLNLNNGKVINEKRYTKMQARENRLTGGNEMEVGVELMRSNDKHIFCVVSGYDTIEDKEKKQRKKALYVFNWDLKPVKRFELPDERTYNLILSYDCSAIYISNHTEEGLVLTKADINI